MVEGCSVPLDGMYLVDIGCPCPRDLDKRILPDKILAATTHLPHTAVLLTRCVSVCNYVNIETGTHIPGTHGMGVDVFSGQ